MSTEIPPRPKLADYIDAAVEKFVEQLNRCRFVDEPLEASEVKALRDVLRHGGGDGFTLARNLDCTVGWYRSVDADLVEWLDGFSTFEAQAEADRVWRKQHAALLDPLKPDLGALMSGTWYDLDVAIFKLGARMGLWPDTQQAFAVDYKWVGNSNNPLGNALFAVIKASTDLGHMKLRGLADYDEDHPGPQAWLPDLEGS